MTKAIRWTPEQLAEFQRRTEQDYQRTRRVLENVAKAPTPSAPDAPVPAQPGTLKQAKYRSKKVVQDGITFDSKKEARRWVELEMMQAEGQISELRRQVPFVLAPAVKLDGEVRTKPALRYMSDFTYVLDGVLVVEDTKSAPTRKLPAYRMKKHLMATVHGIHIKEV
jgi:ethanolamine ammonia-lyase small subunit